MRILKPILGLLIVSSLFFTSCSEEDQRVVYYSKGQLKNNLSVKINKTDGSTISVNSSTTISLTSSDFFEKNLPYLKNVEVSKMTYKIKNYQHASSMNISNMKLIVDDIQITNYLATDLLKASNNGIEFEISNPELLSAIATKLLENRKVVISYYSDAVSSKQLGFDFEFSIITKGVFVD